ncbi:MAG: hypothetical protein IT581_14100 [Verrucomicrobiales bacterium]|nr:hypothetical protein [Verrucomicrobiales bacterium]
MRFPIIILLLLAMLPKASAADPAADWQSITNAIERGLPKTAIELLQPFEAAAIQNQNWGLAGLATATRIQLEVRIQGFQPAERIHRWQAVQASAPLPLRPLYRALLAHSYWGYFQINRWLISQRTPGAATDDFETWDLARLRAEVDRQFNLALESPASLQRIGVADFDGLLDRGELPDTYRPTLYDFLAHEALEFYLANDTTQPLPEDAFELSADGPILGDSAEFLAWKPATTDTNSPRFKAVLLFQDLLRFHQADPDPTAFLDANLARLKMGGNLAVGPRRDRRYVEALDRFIANHASHPVSAMASSLAANALLRSDQPDQAHARAKAGAERFGDSVGGRRCAKIVAEIEQPSLNVRAEGVWTKPWPTLDLRHKNLPSVSFRVVASDWNRFLSRTRNRPDQLSDQEREALLREPPVLNWTASLPSTPDFRERRTSLNVPEGLRPGFYFLLASRRADFAVADNEIAYAPFWISDLALVVRTRAGAYEGLVLDAESGEPITGAKVEAWHLNPRGERVPAAPQTTDKDGAFRFESNQGQRSTVFKASHGARAVALGNELWQSGPPESPRRLEKTVFFTDRSIYRPNQIIQYKGICLGADRAEDRYETLANRRVTVVFRDSNGTEISRANHVANDFGSFHGSFTAPAAAMTGTSTIAIEGEPGGITSFQVEEYKRPKFQVALDAPAEPPRLNQPVTVRGRATTYSGAAVDGASVKWRVVREVRFPPWFFWGRGGWPGMSESQEIAHGRATTSADGTFELNFPALPDAAIPESNQPTFSFRVHSDVTDAAGETRSAERVLNVGYAAIEADVTADDWQTQDQDVVVSAATHSLDGEGAAARGVIRVHRLVPPPRVERRSADAVSPPPMPFFRAGGGRASLPVETGNPLDAWKLGDRVTEVPFENNTNSTAKIPVRLPAGAYRLVLETRDASGHAVTAERSLLVLDLKATHLGVRLPNVLRSPQWSPGPGTEFSLLWGTGYREGRAFIEIEHQHRLIRRFWTDARRTQQVISQAISEAHRGGLTIHVTFVRENRAYIESRRIDVPWHNKEFELTWGTFRSRLEPGQKETWTASLRPRPTATNSVSPTQAERVAAEMVATLYDASLDAFLPTSWPTAFDCFPSDFSTAQSSFSNDSRDLSYFLGKLALSWRDPVDSDVGLYRDFTELASVRTRTRPSARHYFGGGVAGGGERMLNMAMAAPMVADAAMAKGGVAMAAELAGTSEQRPASQEPQPGSPPPPPPPVRKNLQETAFFFPQLRTDNDGGIRFEFQMPEALTEWRFLGFAHDRNLRAGLLEGRTVTARDLMIQPNAPRFLREGDQIEFTAKVVNQSSQSLSGKARLLLRFAADDSDANGALGNREPVVDFEIPAKESRVCRWKLAVPDGCGFLAFKVLAQTDTHSDGEEGWLPVLSRRVFLTESMPIAVRGPGTAEVQFQALADAGRSTSLQHAGLTVQMVSNPSWYAVLALPYLMEYPHECAEQIFNRYYANALASHIARQDPRIQAMFERWRGTEALKSPLQKNADLKSVALEATPWVRQARSETEARQNIAVLFDRQRVDSEAVQAVQKLREMQSPDGGWPWFSRGPFDPYITLYITAGLGRMRQLGLEIPMDLMPRALARVDGEMHKHWTSYRDEPAADENRLSPWIAMYLFARSYFIKDIPVAPAHRQSFERWTDQARRFGVQMNHRQSKGHLALALHRLGDDGSPSRQAAAALVASLKEHAVHTEELGMFWRDTEFSASWSRAPIETQALMIEVFDEVASDAAAVEELKVWLLKQKQTRDWKTTKATADAVYALVRRGTDLLGSRALTQVSAGGKLLSPSSTMSPNPSENVEPGTGFYEVHLPPGEIQPALAALRITKPDAGIAWGGVHWQYFENIEKVRPATATPLTVHKSLFIRTQTKSGPELSPLQGTANVGDELVVRLELRVDRDLEYVHLRDTRGSGTEPVNVLSGYRYQDGLGYYESTRDVASHFFISYLAKGTYVFEYPVRVQLRGRFATGAAEAQCLYAPEFNARSESPVLEVR